MESRKVMRKGMLKWTGWRAGALGWAGKGAWRVWMGRMESRRAGMKGMLRWAGALG